MSEPALNLSSIDPGRRSNSTDLFEQMRDDSTSGLCGIDPQSRITFANRQLTGLLRAPVGSLVGRRFEEIVDPEDHPKVEALRNFRTVDLRFPSGNGGSVWMRCSAFPLLDDDCVIVLMHNVDDLKSSELANARLAAIVESSDDAIVSKSLDGIVATWNRAAERIFGYTSEEMVGQPITTILPKDRLHEEEEILARLRRGESVDHFETVRKTKDGRLVDVSVTISPIRNSDGEVVGASKVARVITDRKLAELALKESESTLRGLTSILEQQVRDRTSALEEALTEMEGFTYTISHDLRTPLRAIVSNCRILEEDYRGSLPSEAYVHIDRQIRAANKLAELIDDLLRVSRIGRHQMRKVDIDLTAMVSELADEYGSSVDIQVQPELRVTGDPTLMRIVFENLLGNSVKFARRGVKPLVVVGRENGLIFVRDNGIGFEQRYAEKVFLPFERLHRDDQFPGTGVGLSNVRRIVQRHGGSVSIRGEPGKGATVWMRL